MAKVTDIELDRQRRIKENMLKMQEFGITAAVLDLAASKAKTPIKRRRSSTGAQSPDQVLEMRRSDRVQKMPAVSYRDLEERNDHLRLVRGGGRRGGGPYRPRGTSWTCPPAARDAAYQKAEAIKVDGPSFVKPLLPSMISGGFWLQWPVDWCNVHMPPNDVFVTLISADDGFTAETKYLGFKKGLSAGWRGYSIDKGLDDGDALAFELLDKHLQAEFCARHLPADAECVLVLEDETGDVWDTIYKPKRAGLSGGWGRFAMDHDLGDGDCAVFEVVEAVAEEKWRMKVHIVRAERDESAEPEAEDVEDIEDEDEVVIPVVSDDTEPAPTPLVKEPSIESPPQKRPPLKRKREAKLSTFYEAVKAKPVAKKAEKKTLTNGKTERPAKVTADGELELKKHMITMFGQRRKAPDGADSFVVRVEGGNTDIWVEGSRISDDDAYCWLTGEEEEGELTG